MQYEEPYMQLIQFERLDIITTSDTVTKNESGDGNEYDAGNWFPRN